MTAVLIPKMFHWIWFGDKPIPEQHKRWISDWLQIHPSWRHRLWTDANRPTFTNEEQFLSAGSFAQKADIARYEIVFRCGGVYLDTDMECIRSLEPLLGNVKAFIAAEKPDSLEQLGIGILGATPGHPWMAELIAKLPQAMTVRVRIVDQTGPLFASAVTAGFPDVTIFPERHFRHEGRRPAEETYAVHHGAKSWHQAEQTKYDAKFRELVTTEIEPTIPPGALFILVAKGRGIEINGGRRLIPFPEHHGEWGGYPIDDAAAIEELERLRRAGAQFIVFPAAMFYWLDTYPVFREYLYANACPAISNERALIFDLRPEVPGKLDQARR
jgi:inositol phosphorylceramide mannosyltransferase catalytic subunit